MTCGLCGNTNADRLRRGMCKRCYDRLQYRGAFQGEHPKVKPTAPSGLDTFQTFVWKHQDTMSIRQIAEKQGRDTLEVRVAMDCCVLALHGRL